MSVGPDVAGLLSGSGPQQPPYINLPADGGNVRGYAEAGASVLDEIRAALEAVMRAHGIDRDEEDKAKYLQIAKLLQDCLAKNQADMDDAMGGGVLGRVMRKA